MYSEINGKEVKLMNKQTKKMLSRSLESVAQYSLDSESLFCFYEPKVPTQLKRKGSKTKTGKKCN